jgi:hypothetical protein
MMENKKLNLPIGIQTFEKLRTGGYVYIDKTQYLVKMIETGNIYFLARPRRFGKSLTVSTFEAIFSGKKELFKGLYAEAFLDKEKFQPHPVIWLDMCKVTTDEGIGKIRESIADQVRNAAEDLDVSLSDNKSPSSLFDELIKKTKRKYNQNVVILLDEYDSPYTDFVTDIKMANKVRDILRNVYVQIKANDAYIHFTFITGISKFARFGVFSVLNTPNDISLSPDYAEVCGYTEQEIRQYFPDYLQETADSMHITAEKLIEKMRKYYNGFSFDFNAEARLYNPFSTLSFFSKKHFISYWINTGRSKTIADYLKHRHLTVEQFRNYPINIDFAESPGDMDTTPPEGFLYQGGYLTLRKKASGKLLLDYPNTEVLNSMSQLLTQNLFAVKANFVQNSLLAALENRDDDRLVEVLNRLLASIPYDDFAYAAEESVSISNCKMTAREWLYRSTILAFMRGCGIVVFPEIHGNFGRSDLIVFNEGVYWVIEIKVVYEGQDPDKKADEALQQIIDNKYAAPYPDAICIGLAIDDKARRITKKSVESNL